VHNDISNFSMLKIFLSTLRPSKVFVQDQMVWKFHDIGWIEININRVGRDSPGLAVYVRILKGKYIRSFSAFLSDHNSLYPEIKRVILVMSILILLVLETLV